MRRARNPGPSPKDAFPDVLPTLLEGRWWYGHLIGNPPFAPYRDGWLLCVDGRTLPEEKRWLKANGFAFHGGKWVRFDP